MTHAIIHLNVADFAVAVERQMDHRLKDRPVIIGRAAATRAVVYDMSEEAYAGGSARGCRFAGPCDGFPMPRYYRPTLIATSGPWVHCSNGYCRIHR